MEPNFFVCKGGKTWNSINWIFCPVIVPENLVRTWTASHALPPSPPSWTLFLGSRVGKNQIIQMIHIPEAMKRFWAPGSQGTQRAHRDWGQLSAETRLGMAAPWKLNWGNNYGSGCGCFWFAEDTQKQKGRRQFPPAKFELTNFKKCHYSSKERWGFVCVFVMDYPGKVLHQENDGISHLKRDAGPPCKRAGRVP